MSEKDLRSILRAMAVALPSLLACMGAGAKSHLVKGEAKSLSAASLTVVYMDPSQPLAGYLDPDNTAAAPGLIGLAVAESVNERRLNEFAGRLQPYQTELGMLGIPDSLYATLHGTLLQVPWLQKAAWQRVQEPTTSGPSIRKVVHEAKTQVVVVVSPRLLMSVDGKKLTLRTTFDIEIANPAGSYNIEHYDITESDVTWDVNTDGMPPVPQVPGLTADVTGARLATFFAGDAKGFRLMFEALQPKAQDRTYYYFTGDALPPPVSASAAAR